jgi:hypothetical protein
MKNLMTKFGGLFLVLGCLMVSSNAHAVWYRGAPKEVFVSSYTTGAVQVTPSVSSSTALAAQYMPGAIYQVILSTGASSEYVVIYDTTNCIGLTATSPTGNTPAQTYQNLGPRFVYGSTSADTVLTFDPPLRFDMGLCVLDSATTGQYSITYELGRGISGQ